MEVDNRLGNIRVFSGPVRVDVFSHHARRAGFYYEESGILGAGEYEDMVGIEKARFYDACASETLPPIAAA